MKLSPCMRCTKVPDPGACDNKDCAAWRKWYIGRWNDMRFSLRGGMEKVKREPVGVCIGGQFYAQPHIVRNYLRNDPCRECLCPRDLCALPCAVKRSWLAARETITN